MTRLRVLIVDDEPLVRDGIRNGLKALPDVDVLGECSSGRQAIEAISSKEPNLVLLDVEMQDCSGLDVVRHIGPEQMPLVIFITAYDQYAVKAFELNAVDYLLKPFDEERLTNSIQRARERIAAHDQLSLARHFRALLELKQPQWPERVIVHNADRFDMVPVESIDWIESADNYAQLHCGNKEYLLNETLTSLENRLDPTRFLRIHRRRIVNLSRLNTIHSLVGGIYALELRNGTRLTTGRHYRAAIQKLIRYEK